MTNKNARYTTDDDKLILESIQEAKDNDLDLQAVYMVLAEKLGRDPGSIDTRYNKIKKPDDSKGIVAKIKAAIQEKERYRKEAEEYKTLYQELKRTHDQLLKDLGSMI